MPSHKKNNQKPPVNPLTLPKVQKALLAGQPVPEPWRKDVADLAPLFELTGLTVLDLSRTGVTDVSALAGLKGVRHLDLSATDVTDVSALAGLGELRHLDLSWTRVTDVSALAGLGELRRLYLIATGVRDVSVLAHLKNLRIVGSPANPPAAPVPKIRPSAASRIDVSASTGTPTAASMADRVKLVFDDERKMQQALRLEVSGLAPRLVSPRRGFIAVQRPAGMAEDQFAAQVERLMKRAGARAVPDFRYSLEDRPRFSPTHTLPEDAVESGGNLDDVLKLIGIDDRLDNRSRGQGVSIAIVDTGINGLRSEFPNRKRGWAPVGEDAWADEDGHGTMCATIAAASPARGGAFRGVAPAAHLIPCKTWFYSSELAAIYDELAGRAEAGEVIVASNSFGIPQGTPPDLPEGYDDFHDALVGAIAAGVRVVFSAGNYHDMAGGTADSHEPNTVWLEKGRADLLTVAACDETKAMWYYSSRGPGQYFHRPDDTPAQFLDDFGIGRKPDVTAPTPRNGRILFGDETVVMPDGWGTSGAAPQVAGLLALLLSLRPDLPRDELFDIVRSSARDLGFRHEAQGHGMIDCRKALDRFDERVAAGRLAVGAAS